MKRIVFTILATGLITTSLSAQTNKDTRAKELYYSALDAYENSNYKGALTKLKEAEKTLGGTNARLSHLYAKTYNALGDYSAARAACASYFASKPRKDAGFEDMQEIAEIAAANLATTLRKEMEEAEARKEAEEARISQEKQEAAALAERMKKAAARRAEDAEHQKERDEKELAAYKSAQSANTQDAYQKFIYDYPSGKHASEAKSEMLRKWPYPIRALKNSKYGYIDKNGKFVIKAKYDNATEFSEGLARVGKDGKYGFVDVNGKEVIPLNYTTASNFNYGYAVLKSGNNNAIIVDKNGKTLGENYYDAKSFSEGLAAVQNESYLYGFINTHGDMVISYKFNTVSWFKEGIVAVGKTENGKMKYAYMNKEGEMLTAFEFDEAKDFQGGVGRIKKDGKFGLIDKFGSPITCCEFDYISEFDNQGYAVAKKNGFNVLLDKEGRPWAKVNGKLVKVTL